MKKTNLYTRALITGLATALTVSLPAYGQLTAAKDVWSVSDHIASAPAVIASDGSQVHFEVHCKDNKPWPVLKHTQIESLISASSINSGPWPNTLTIRFGWGLDLRNPDHYGAQTYWQQCRDEANCLESAPQRRETIVANLISNYSVFIKLDENTEFLDAEMSLSGSAAAIRSVCSLG